VDNLRENFLALNVHF